MAYLYYPSWLKPYIIPQLPFLRWYGLMYAVAFGIAYYLTRYQVRTLRLEEDADDLIDFFFWSIIGLLVGARLFSTLIYDTSGLYWKKPWLIFWPFDEDWNYTGLQGMSFHGGVVGGLTGMLFYCFKKKKNFLEYADMLAAAIPLGYTFGRLGNFINAELYGRVTTMPWGMFFDTATRFPAKEGWVQRVAEKAGIILPPNNMLVNLPRHPSQLYEAFFEGIVLWLFMWFVIRPRKSYNGMVMSWFFIGYGTIRFFLEYFRQPDENLGFIIKLVPDKTNIYLFETFFNFTMGQVLNFLMIIAGVVIMFALRNRHRNKLLSQ
ncbi:prolipoprotein diacylglyceryl transferase [Spirochaetia bacterium 38H-sp]|uniref:Phosphatidylglycerol--prolipoprotein diacylglyceryl transferase n=1 Tax=Rarispira pelagica TaxID=3141764 RepID=A0ABU9U995_9SPIR